MFKICLKSGGVNVLYSGMYQYYITFFFARHPPTYIVLGTIQQWPITTQTPPVFYVILSNDNSFLPRHPFCIVHDTTHQWFYLKSILFTSTSHHTHTQRPHKQTHTQKHKQAISEEKHHCVSTLRHGHQGVGTHQHVPLSNKNKQQD